MKLIFKIALVVTTLGLAGCAEGKYPVSGETCAPDDSVHKLDANDCTVPGL